MKFTGSKSNMFSEAIFSAYFVFKNKTAAWRRISAMFQLAGSTKKKDKNRL